MSRQTIHLTSKALIKTIVNLSAVCVAIVVVVVVAAVRPTDET